jgi:CheY-like chemotaxis protein
VEGDVGVRALVVEDHVELARDIAEGLRDRGIATTSRMTGRPRCRRVSSTATT